MKKQRNRHILYGICAIIISAILVFSDANLLFQNTSASSKQPSTRDYELVDEMQDAAILHCWNWSYKTIEDNMRLIAECGYSAIQTSPATQPKDYAYEGVVGTDVGTPGVGGSGNWWKVYQPVTISVCDNGQTWLGTKAELESLCETAEKYGIKVIVDVVANHMGNIKGWSNSLSDISAQVGDFWNPNMLTDESFWHINSHQVWMSDSRLHFTQGTLGMPDLNTADKRIQRYFMDYLDELIDCGVDGFRFDAAKHIETPDDDPAFASDFWPTVLGEARSHYKSKTGEELYVYGEILNTVGIGFSIDSYTKYMSVTDNAAGHHLLESFRNNNLNVVNMHYDPSVSVIWAESHDTYMNESSRYSSDKSIVRTWALIANKDNAAGLFFVRPYYSKDILEGDVDGAMKGNLHSTLTQATMGACETYLWATDEVAAINHFNNRMVNVPDNMGCDGSIAYCFRGNGVALVNFNGSGNISISARGMAEGVYTDEVSGNTFRVSNGVLSGEIDSEYGVAVVYQNVMPNPGRDYPVQIKNSVGDGTEFYSDRLELTVEALYADSARYYTSTGESGTFNGTTTIQIGAGLSNGEQITLTIEGTNSKGTVSKAYTYTKAEYDLESCIFFKNTSNWSEVTAYIWNDTASPVKTNAGWPGETMFECDPTEGIYALKIDANAGYTKIIFSSKGSSQTKDLMIGNIGQMYDMNRNMWVDYIEEEKTPSIVATKNSSIITAAESVTYSVSNAERATYSINNAAPVEFRNLVTLTIGENLAEGEVETVTIFAENASKSKTSVYEYTKDYTVPTIEATVESGYVFKDSLKVTFSTKNAEKATINVNGVEESFKGSITKTFAVSANVTVNATNGTKNCEEKYVYTLYIPVVPTVTASKASGTTFTDSLEIKFTVVDAMTATISDGINTSAITNSTTVTTTDTVTYTITVSNGIQEYIHTYTYTKTEQSDDYIFFNVNACSWFGNDSAVAAVKFNNENAYTKCEQVIYNNTVYYKAAVPEGATAVNVCRMVANGNTYNILTIKLSDNNVWTSNSSFNGGSWKYDAGLAGRQVDEMTTIYFINNYNWNGTIYAYYWGGSASVAWPGTAMTYVGVDSNGKPAYMLTIPSDITGLIFSNGSAQTVDITDNIADGNQYSIAGKSGNKYAVAFISSDK